MLRVKPGWRFYFGSIPNFTHSMFNRYLYSKISIKKFVLYKSFSFKSTNFVCSKKTSYVSVFYRYLKRNRRLFLKSNNLFMICYLKSKSLFKQVYIFFKKEFINEYNFYRNLRVKDLDIAHLMAFFLTCCIIFTIYFLFFAD